MRMRHACDRVVRYGSWCPGLAVLGLWQALAALNHLIFSATAAAKAPEQLPLMVETLMELFATTEHIPAEK